MKILHLLYESRGDYYGIGGVGIRAYEIYRHLKGRHDITLLCKRYPGAEDRQIEGLRHLYAGTESTSLTSTLLSYAYHSSRFVRTRGVEFDVIIEEFSPGIPTLLGFYRKRPLVLQIQGYTGKKYFEKYHILYSSVLYAFEKSMPLFYKNYIVVSESTKKRYHLDGSMKNVAVISNGIGEELFRHDPGESDYILYLGRIDIHHKGLDLLLRAYAEFYRSFPEIKLMVAGDGKDRERFLSLLKKLPGPVQKNIELKGWVEGERKISLFRDALFVAVPSRYETQGIVALEAMACGKPLLVSDIPELRYITDNGAGISFTAGDASALSNVMKVLASGDDRTLMGERGREWVKQYTWQGIAAIYEEFLLGVVEKWHSQTK